MMTFDTQTIGAVTVLKPLGPIANVEDSALLLEQSTKLVRTSLGRFVIDASEMSYVDSTGLETLVDVSAQLSAFGQTLKLCAIGETVSETIRITQTSDAFEPFEQVQDAVRSYR